MSNTNMKLLAFRVTNFRSVRDSGWIDADSVTALIGTNESGKTNLLTPLWKLNPAKDGAIKLITDAPRRDFNEYRDMKEKPVFIRARFELMEKLMAEVAAKAGVAPANIKNVEVTRNFDGKYAVFFPEFNLVDLAARKSDLSSILEQAAVELDSLTPSGKADETLKQSVLVKVGQARALLVPLNEHIEADGVAQLQAVLTPTPDEAPAKSTIAPRYAQVVDLLAAHAARLAKGSPEKSPAVCKLVIDNLPAFVYYSTYGNLDSEIYLPRVIEDLKRTDLTDKAEARARTLRILFEFVKLKPEEILKLGKEWNEPHQGKATEATIQAEAENKRERSVLIQSASTDLTTKFREWWKQGNYRFRFEADGNHFRIWVADDLRPEDIELEGRSTGLQWFLTFYLVFLVESKAAHNGAILLLDEPGLSLHPLAQRDLSAFFENLAESNQLLYTTHSPFLVDSDHIDRVRNVYVDEKGYTVASPDLRAGAVAAQTKSVYAVHASLGLSVSDTILQGCKPIVVEGLSDQIYMSAIKNLLVRSGRISTTHELVFVPGKGARAIKAIVAILGGRDNDLPTVLCDGDPAGKEVARDLKNGFYTEVPERVMLMTDFAQIPDAEVEDLLPRSVMVQVLDRYIRGPVDQVFSPLPEAPLVPQVKAYATKHKIELKDGWKVEVARLVKARLSNGAPADQDTKAALEVWVKLFAVFTSESKTTTKLASAPSAAAAALN